MLNVEAKSETLRFLELVITIDADRLSVSCRLWNSVACNTGSGDTVLTRLLMLTGGTDKVGRLSWVVGAIHRILQECDDKDNIVLSIQSGADAGAGSEWPGWWTGLLGITTAKVEQSIVMRGNECHRTARLLYEVWVALKLYPETPGGG